MQSIVAATIWSPHRPSLFFNEKIRHLWNRQETIRERSTWGRGWLKSCNEFGQFTWNLWLQSAKNICVPMKFLSDSVSLYNNQTHWVRWQIRWSTRNVPTGGTRNGHHSARESFFFFPFWLRWWKTTCWLFCMASRGARTRLRHLLLVGALDSLWELVPSARPFLYRSPPSSLPFLLFSLAS